MTLTTHAVAGAAIATTMPAHPIIGFVLGFASHFVLDAIPHWDYKLRSTTGSDALDRDMVMKGKDFYIDMLKIGTDMLMAILLPLLIFGLALGHGLHDTQMVIAILCGAIGGVFPDGLQFVYWKLRREPLYSLQKFHQWIQNEQLHPYPLAGVMAQATLILLIVGSRYLL